MAKKLSAEDKKYLIVTCILVLFGAAFTAMSFCVYYLVKPRNTAVLSVICIVDFLYGFFCAFLLFKFGFTENKPLLKGILLSVGYIAAFIVVATVICLFSGSPELLKKYIVKIVLFAFFTSPCIYIILALVILCLMGA